MATKMKVYEIAKSLNRTSKDLLKALNENNSIFVITPPVAALLPMMANIPSVSASW